MGQILKNGDVVVASGGGSGLWGGLSMRQAIQNWNMMHADIARSPESALRAFTSSEGLANQLNEDEVGEVGNLLKKKVEMDATRGENLVKKIEMDAARNEKW